MEKGFTLDGFLNFVEATDIENAITTIPLEALRNGFTCPIDGGDFLSWCCSMCKTDEIAFRVAHTLLNMGYTYRFGCSSYYSIIAYERRWKLFHYLMDISGAYYDPERLRLCIGFLNRRNIDPFLDRGINLELSDKVEHLKFLNFYTHREKARIASIALIGVGKRRNRLYSSALDVMRVISRVVWSERCDEKWSE